MESVKNLKGAVDMATARRPITSRRWSNSTYQLPFTDILLAGFCPPSPRTYRGEPQQWGLTLMTTGLIKLSWNDWLVTSRDSSSRFRN